MNERILEEAVKIAKIREQAPQQTCSECQTNQVQLISNVNQYKFRCRHCGHKWTVPFKE